MLTSQSRWIVVALFVVFCTPVMADVQAVYARGNTGKETLTVEIAEDGALRVSQPRYGMAGYFLSVGGQSYSVEPGPGGPTVITVEAVAEMTRRMGGVTFRQNLDEKDKPAPIHYAATGATEIAGYAGIRYNFPDAYDPEATQIVLSDDPALRPLGNAFVSYAQAAATMSGSEDEESGNFYQLLAEHGILAVWGYKLQSVSFAPIDRSRFAVPATPLTLAELLQSDPSVNQPTDSEPLAVEAFVVSAAFLDQTLFTLLSDGRLQAWPEGAEMGNDVQVPAFASAVCELAGELLLVTGRPEEGTAGLWAGRPGAWSLLTEFAQSESDPFIALDCSGPQPIMLSASAIRSPSESRPITAASGAAIPFGPSATLQHGGFLYVGINAGEFGGGLMRFPLAGGSGELIDASSATEICGGLLNKDCDPVTGLAIDPFRPDCILATVGLEHFTSHGSVVRVCGESVSLAYSKPYTIDPNWKFDPESITPTFASVSFSSLAGDDEGAWAVANDGTYHFGEDGEPEFLPFPRFSRFPKNGVDWSNPEFVLVLTTMNQRFSVSGGSLILVPR